MNDSRCFSLGVLLVLFLLVADAHRLDSDLPFNQASSRQGASTASAAAAGSATPCTGWTSQSGWFEGPACPATYQLVDVLSLQNSNFSMALQKAIAVLDTFQSQFGFTIGVVLNQTTVLTKGFGTKSFTNRETPDENTIYMIGSMTKIITSLMFAKLLDQGVVHIDDTLQDYWNSQNPPVYNVTNPYGEPDLPLQALASQTSGIPREPPGTVYNFPNYTESEIFDIMNNYYVLGSQPYSTPHYSNLGLTLLGRTLERAVGVQYEDYVVNELFAPLGMSNSGFYITEEQKQNASVGYAYNSLSGWYADPLNFVPLGWAAPCGGAFSTVKDLSQFLKWIFGDGAPLLSAETLVKYSTIPGINFEDGTAGYGGFTWESFYANNFNTMTKAGLTAGFASSIAFVPELKLGVVVLYNAAAGNTPNTFTGQLLAILVPALVADLQNNQPAPALPENYQELLGPYCISGQQVAIVAGPASGTTGTLSFTSSFLSAILTYDPSQIVPNIITLGFRWVTPPVDGFDTCGDLYSFQEGVFFFSQFEGVSGWNLTSWDVPVSLNKC